MRYSLCALLLAAMPLVPVRVERAIDDSLRCSIRVVPGYRVRADAVLLATASADTVLTGPGHIVPSVFGGHSGAGAPGPIFGQMFEVARFSGADSLRLATAFKTRGDMRVVIVPWDYDPACDPTRWSRGFAWVPVANAGTFTVALRPDSLWTDGIPVFDAFIEWSVRRSTAEVLEAPARFWLDDGGRLQVEQTTRLAEGQTLVVRGERVSAQVVACEW